MTTDYDRLLGRFRDRDLIQAIAARLAKLSVPRKVALMEVCGTHTVAIFRHGIRDLLPRNVRLISGPGCPVCVTSASDIDQALGLARNPAVTLTTFGDMMKVPGAGGSLLEARASGADVEMVYSPLDALKLAQERPDRSVVFLGVGFETTTPAIAAAIAEAARLGLNNFYVLSYHKIVPPAMRALLSSGEVRVDGFLCPGHVSVIIGSQAYEGIAADYGVPCAVAGFEPVDIARSLEVLIQDVLAQNPAVRVEYSRTVTREGNRHALALMDGVFEVADATWRGLGNIPGSGLRIREEYARFDAARAFDLPASDGTENPLCRCGDVLKGVIDPVECPLFSSACTPDTPVGPCMVSTEGSCSAWYQYGNASS